MRKKLLKILLIIVLVQVLLLTYAFISPTISIPYVNDETIEIQFPELGSLLDLSYKEVDTKKADYVIQPIVVKDTVAVSQLLVRRKLNFSEKKTINTYLINPSLDNKTNALASFFGALAQLTDSTSIRIAHYGDSQLEGDRLTNVIRTRFQEKFGGTGIGFVPFTDITSHVQLLRKQSGNWNRHTVFSNQFYSSYYGVSGMVFNFLNSSFGNRNKREAATISFSMYKKAHYDKVSVMYGQALSDCKISCQNSISGKQLLTDILPATKEFSIQELEIDANQRRLHFIFSGVNSPNFYGFLFDGNSGVQVDNFAIRGHSGDGLKKINSNYLKKQLEQLNTKLLIFQFGANVVPYITNATKLKKFEQDYYKLLMKYKKAMPDLAILVVSTGDMATRKNGFYRSYNYLPQIRDAQKRAALKAGCAFWDLYDSMGGYNSILRMADKKLASKDGHFSPSGQQQIGGKLFQAIMSEYKLYLYQQRTKHFTQE